MWIKSVTRPQCYVVIFMILFMSDITEESYAPSVNTSNGKICRSLDIRNSVDSFEMLRGCEVVEGFLQIILFDKTSESDFENISFPELREITCYLLLWRVRGLRSVGQLFPNLAVIRGNNLFVDYALVVYEMFQLQEIGLHGLTYIERGDIRIEKNPRLCYVDTIDWGLIASGERVIVQNKPKEECSSLVCAELKCARSLCWGSNHCQKLHQEGCHEMCLGGCTGPGPKKCTVCKHLLVDGECVSSCPPDRYSYLSRRCLTEEECRSIIIYSNNSSIHEYDVQEISNFWTFNQTCIESCPTGYEVKYGDGGSITCEECRGRCRNECRSNVVDSIAAAQRLSGCTYINGSLEIQILRGKHIVKELENSLSMIEEIHGYLKVARSFSLISLSFLKNLKVIHGNELDNGKYALVVLDNENLQELWDWDSTPDPKFEIRNGRLFFHFNPKLCRYHIDRLQALAGLTNVTNHEVANESNGDKVACNVINFSTKVSIKGSTLVVIEWEPCEVPDPSSLLGYIVYYIEAPNQNITAYDGRDACGDNGWKLIDVSIPDDTESNVTTSPRNINFLLTHLQPFTQYAFYVLTYSVTSTGGQSDIKYFTTLPGRPSLPRDFTAISNSSTEIYLQWDRPLHPNGVLTHYIISGVWLSVDQQFLDDRDYCIHPLNPQNNENLILTQVKTAVNNNTTTEAELDCNCEEPEGEKLIHDRKAYVEFCHSCTDEQCEDKTACDEYVYNFLHTTLSSKTRIYEYMNGDKENFTHQVPPEGKKFPDTVTHSWPMWGHSTSPNDIVFSEGRYKQFYKKVNANETYIVLNDLHHFGEYVIKIIACREHYVPNPGNIVQEEHSSCSFASLVTVRTQQCSIADVINSSHVTVEILNRTIGAVHLKWKEPKSPNGLVVSYYIEFRRTDIEHYKPKTDCITRKQYLADERGYILRNLLPGKYGFRIKATSLAGDGDFTETVYLNIEEPSEGLPHPIVISITLGTALMFIFIFLFLYCWKKCNSRRNMKLIATVNPDYMGSRGHYVEDEWEIARDRLELHGELGQGTFGMVYEGVLRPTKIRCAVKIVNENASLREQMEFLNEASVMKSFSSAHHIVRLLGVVSRGKPPLVIMELMARGDLKSFLRASRYNPSETPGLTQILRMSAEIADGMAYLEASKFVHRDLAARNCMVTEDLTVKIGDFGMTRDIYETDYYRNGSSGLLPVRWMAPESLADGVFSSQSDVWSYGVVLWEMATLAQQPYQGLANEQVLQYVLGAGVLERPPSCPDILHDLMLSCWKWQPLKRPTFLQLLAKLEESSKLSPLFQKLSFYHSIAGQELKKSSSEESDIKSEYVAACPPHVAFYHSDDIIVHSAQNSGIAVHSPSSDNDFKMKSIKHNDVQCDDDYVESTILLPDSASSKCDSVDKPKNKIPNGDSNGYVIHPLPVCKTASSTLM